MTGFSNFGLAEPLCEAARTAGHDAPTAIQSLSIPPILQGRDLLGIAQTGTGKTAAFALPIVHRLLAAHRPAPPRACLALVLAPTRELAAQTCDRIRLYSGKTPIRTALLVGGLPKPSQAKALARGVDIVVATPGRLLDLIADRAVILDETRTLVLDEADHMLDLGFADDVQAIADLLPQQHQTLMFSATMPPAIADLARRLLHDPVRVEASRQASAPERIDQRVIFVETPAKRATLIELLKAGRMGRTLVFTRTKANADAVVAALDAAGIRSAALHGDKSQPHRDRTLAAFRANRLSVVVATDVAARGIDIDGLSHVVNFEIPEVPETYVHRVGRTARAGAGGVAISLCSGPERQALRAIEKLTGTRLRVFHRRPV